MPDIAANSEPIALGDWKQGYVIADRIQMFVLRLVELYSANGMVGLQFRKRVGGKVVQPQAIVVLKICA